MRKLHRTRVFAVYFGLLLGAATAGVAADQWNHTVIDSTGAVYWVSMEMDPWNLPHIAYAIDGQIWYATRHAGEWNWITELVAPVGNRPSITLRADGSPVIVFSADYSGDVGVADLTDNGWTLEYLDLTSLQSAGQYSPADGLHIYYIDENNRSSIQHMRRWYGNWYNLASFYLANNPQVSPFVSDYHPAWGPLVGYTYKWFYEGDSWSYVMLNEQGFYGGFWTSYSISGRPAFEILGDRAAICYKDGGDLFYIEDTGYGAPSYGPYLIAESAMSPSLAEDTQGRIHIVCRLQSNAVGYFVKTGESWESTELPHSVYSYGLDLETDSNGEVHIAMMTVGGKLEYTWYGDPTGIPEDMSQFTGRILHQVIPQPAGNSVTVMLDEGVTGPVMLSVVDLSGRTVITRMNEDMETVMDLSGLSSGVYLITAEQGNCLDSALLTVLR